jgi:acetyl esterase/lipase
MSRPVAASLFAILLAVPAFAAEPYWAGARSANWSEPANWTPARVPGQSEAIEFTGWGRPTVNFDLPPGTAVGPLTFLGEYTLGGNRMLLSGDWSFVSSPSAVPFVCNADLTLGANVRFYQSIIGNYNGAIDVNGKTFTIDTYNTVVRGPIAGDGTILINGLGLNINSSGSFAGTINGRLNVIGSYPNATVTTTRLSGSGALGKVTAGLVSPGDWPPFLNGDNRTVGTLQTGPLAITSMYSVDLVPGGASDRVRVEGPVSIGGTLEVVTHGSVAAGQSFTIIDNDGTDPVSGTFSNLPEGATFTVGSTAFRITYAGGDGNDVVLNAFGNPTTTTLAQSSDNTNLHESVTFTASVASPAGVPTGAVTFYEGSQAIGSGTLNNGVATFTTDSFAAGTHIVHAIYLGDDRFGGSTSADVYHGVFTYTPRITVTSSPSAVSYGDDVTFTIHVTADAGVTDPLTGTVSINVDATPTGLRSTLSADGIATIVVPRITGGAHGIMVVYSGNAYFRSGTAQMTQHMAKAPTQTIAESPENPTQVGSAIVLNARVNASLHPELTVDGLVQVFEVGGMPMAIAQALLVDGAATLRIDSLPAGDHVLQVVYAGNQNFAGSSTTWTQHVVAGTAATTTTIAQDRETTKVHEAVTFTATVASSNATPSGTVEFRDGAQQLGSATLQNGVGTFTTSSLSAGTHSVTAAFAGTASFAASSSAAITHTVVKRDAQVTVTASPSIVVYGDSVTFTITASGDVDVPTGGVTLTIDGALAGTATLSATGSAAITIPTLAAGTHAIGVAFGGDATFNAATATMTLNVAKAATTISLASPVNPSEAGSAVLLNVRVNASAHPALTVGGAVRIVSGANTLAQAQLVDDAATLRIDSLTPGDHPLQAVFDGSANFESSTSATLTQHVNAAALPATTTTLAQNSDSTNVHQPVTFTATVNATTGAPAGTVTFFDDASAIGSSVLQRGVATLTTKNLTAGAHAIIATFAGSDAFASSTSAALVHSVVKHNPHGTITSTPTSPAYGDSITFTITFEAAAGVTDVPTGNVTLRIDGIAAGTSTLSSAGTASMTIPLLPAGTHDVTASYDGDNSFNAATAATTLNVARAATLVSIKPSSTQPANGSALALTIRVTAPAHPALPVDGSVTISTGGNAVAQAQLIDGAAVVRIDSLAAGTYDFKAVYSGSANFEGSSAATTQQVGVPSIALAAATIVEGNAAHDEALRIDLSAPATQLVTVEYRSVDGTAIAGSDYVAAQGTITFLPGQTSATIPLRIFGDSDIEPEETFAIALTNAIGATIGTPNVTIEIANDDLSYRAAADYTYATVDGTALRATVFSPINADGARPAILWIEGDGAYDAQDDSIAALRQTARGYTVVRLSYRSPAVAPFPAQIHDLQTAVRWLRANATMLGLDVNRFIAWGTGAGGHLAALLGTGMGSNDRADRVQAVIDWSGIADPAALDRDALACSTIRWNAATSPVSQLIGCSAAECPASADATAPARYVAAGDAAMLLMHGAADCFVSPMQSERLYDSLKRAGVDATLRVYDDVGHGGAFWTSAAAYADVDAFLDRTMQRRRLARH